MDYARITERLASCVKPEDVSKLFEAHRDLNERTESELPAPRGGEWGDSDRIRAYSLVIRQALLHRSIGTYEGAMCALLCEQTYSMVLSIRAHFETVAALGYLYGRLRSLSRGDLLPEMVDKDIGTILLGIREGGPPEAPSPKLVLEQLDWADRVVSTELLKGRARQHKLLTECYKFLCEFCHPNFHSHSVSIDVDKSRGTFRILHGQPMRQREVELIEYLLMSAPIHILLHDGMLSVLPNL